MALYHHSEAWRAKSSSGDPLRVMPQAPGAEQRQHSVRLPAGLPACSLASWWARASCLHRLLQRRLQAVSRSWECCCVFTCDKPRSSQEATLVKPRNSAAFIKPLAALLAWTRTRASALEDAVLTGGKRWGISRNLGCSTRMQS